MTKNQKRILLLIALIVFALLVSSPSQTFSASQADLSKEELESYIKEYPMACKRVTRRSNPLVVECIRRLSSQVFHVCYLYKDSISCILNDGK